MEKAFSLIRHILTIVGGYLLMKGITDSSTIEAAFGVLSAGGALYWSIKSKTATAEQWSGFLRQFLSFAGGFAMAWFKIPPNEWAFWVTAVISLVPFFQKSAEQAVTQARNG